MCSDESDPRYGLAASGHPPPPAPTPDPPDTDSDPERWLRSRVAELESTLAGIRRRQVDALRGVGEPDTDDRARVGAVHREVLARLPTPIVVIADDAVVLYANRAAARFFGVTFGIAGGATLAQCIGERAASPLESLRPDSGPVHTLIDAPDGAGPVRAHAFLVPIADDVVRGLQIDWDPEAERAG